MCHYAKSCFHNITEFEGNISQEIMLRRERGINYDIKKNVYQKFRSSSSLAFRNNVCIFFLSHKDI